MFFIVLEPIVHPESRLVIYEKGDTIGPDDIKELQALGVDHFKVDVCLTIQALHYVLHGEVI